MFNREVQQGVVDDVRIPPKHQLHYLMGLHFCTCHRVLTVMLQVQIPLSVVPSFIYTSKICLTPKVVLAS